MNDEPEEESNDLDQPPPFFRADAESSDLESVDYGDPVLVQVEDVLAASSDTEDIERAFVLLSSGERKLPIVIGPCATAAITVALEGQRENRPLTHDLVKNMLDRVGVEVVRLVIDDLWRGVFYGKLVLKPASGEEVEVDCRPSDGIAIALRAEAPIYVAEGILERGHS